MWLNSIYLSTFKVGHILRSQQDCEISTQAPPHQPHTPCWKVNWRRRAWPSNLLHRHHRPGDGCLNINPVRNLPSVCGHPLSRSDWQSRWMQPAGKNPEHNRNHYHQQLQPSWRQTNEAKPTSCTEKHLQRCQNRCWWFLRYFPLEPLWAHSDLHEEQKTSTGGRDKCDCPDENLLKNDGSHWSQLGKMEKQDRKPWPPVWSAHQQWLPTASLCGPCRRLLRDENQGWTSLHSPHRHAPPVDTGSYLQPLRRPQPLRPVLCSDHKHYSLTEQFSMQQQPDAKVTVVSVVQ